MCSLTTFRALSFAEQLKLMSQRGTFLAVRPDQHTTVHLFALDFFFVEVCCCPAIFQVRAFAATDQLEAYLPAIELKLL
jgi:hypothetical protein